MARQEVNYRKCEAEKLDCFGCNSEGKCEILTRTKFKDDICPFYKTTEQYEKEK